jgi:hypothetical protein
MLGTGTARAVFQYALDAAWVQMWPLWLGLAMVIAGEVIRKTAMVGTLLKGIQQQRAFTASHSELA